MWDEGSRLILLASHLIQRSVDPSMSSSMLFLTNEIAGMLAAPLVFIHGATASRDGMLVSSKRVPRGTSHREEDTFREHSLERFFRTLVLLAETGPLLNRLPTLSNAAYQDHCSGITTGINLNRPVRKSLLHRHSRDPDTSPRGSLPLNPSATCFYPALAHG